jgi:hypothetical protein
MLQPNAGSPGILGTFFLWTKKQSNDVQENGDLNE